MTTATLQTTPRGPADGPEIVEDWRRAFADALTSDTEGRTVLAAMGTYDGRRPRARTVVHRRFEGDGRVWYVSDARSGKNAQLRENHSAEVVYWFGKSRTQWRIAGNVEVIGAHHSDADVIRLRQEAFINLSPEARALFFWPTPGGAVAGPDAYPREIKAVEPMPATFELLVLTPRWVERLVLTAHPHRRRVWSAEARWHPSDVSP